MYLNIRLNTNFPYIFQVGENLQDHVTVDGVVVALHPNKSTTDVQIKQLVQELYKNIHTGKGALGSTGPLSVGVFLKSSFEYQHGCV